MEVIELIIEDLHSLQNYFTTWQILVNVGKCEVLHLGHNNPRSSYRLNESDLPYRNHGMDLGNTIHGKMSFRKYYEQITRNVYFRIRQLRLYFDYKSLEFQLFIYKTYLRPILEQNTQIQFPHYMQDIFLIERVLNCFTEFLLDMQDYANTQRLTGLGPKLEERRTFQDLVLFYRNCR